MVLPKMLSLQTRCWIHGFVCLLLAWGWLAANVTASYDGNWTGLFIVGKDRPLPPDPEFDDVYQQAHGQGFDGQHYLIAAHDPFLQKDYWKFIDWPGLRYMRILQPLLAWALPLPVPVAFVLVHLLFVALGTAGVGLIAVERNQAPEWAYAFLLLPAVWISLDRMTVDLAFLAIFVWVCYRPRWLPLALLCLVRETGLVAVAAVAVWHLYHKRWRSAASAASAAAPFAIWALFVVSRFEMKLWQWLPNRTPFARTVEDLSTLAAGRMPVGLAMDALALAALAYAVWWAFQALIRQRECPRAAMGALFAAMGLYLFALGDWIHVYDYGRVLSPLFAIMLLQGIAIRRWELMAPAALITARVGVQLLPRLQAIATEYF